MSPERTKFFVRIAVVVLLTAGVIAIAWHLMPNRVQVPGGETKVIDAVQQTKFPPPRAPVAPQSDESILSSVTNGSVTVRWEHAPGATATTPYKEVPPPSDRDAATHAEFTWQDGLRANPGGSD